MNRFRQYTLILLVVIPLALLVLIRENNAERFKHDARKRAEASFTKTNLISREKLAALSSTLIIELSSDGSVPDTRGTVHIPVDSLLMKTSLNIIRRHKGPVLLHSADQGISAKAWMILSEMGYDNLFILTDDPGNEVIKYKFRPDTSRSDTSTDK